MTTTSIDHLIKQHQQADLLRQTQETNLAAMAKEQTEKIKLPVPRKKVSGLKVDLAANQGGEFKTKVRVNL